MSKNKQMAIITYRLFSSQMISIMSTSMVLVMIGIVTTLFVIAQDLSTYVRENVGFSLILDNEAKSNEVLALQKRISTYPEVKQVKAITKEEAFEVLKKELGEDPTDFLGYNPLSASLEVYLKAEYANNESMEKIQARLQKIAGVQEVLYRKDLVQIINENINRIGSILSIIALILLFISYALISNTIRLTIYSKRFLIQTMKLVGASRSFIGAPFIKRNIGGGILASLFAILFLYLLLIYLFGGTSGFLTLTSEAILFIVGVIFFFGIVITSVAAYFAVNKYIDMSRDKLYYI